MLLVKIWCALHLHPARWRRFRNGGVGESGTKSLGFDWTLYDKATLMLRNGIKSKPQKKTCQATIVSTATESVTAQRFEWTSFKSINWLNIRQLTQFKSPAQFQSHDIAYLTPSSKFEPRRLLTPMYTSVNMSSLQTSKQYQPDATVVFYRCTHGSPHYLLWKCYTVCKSIACITFHSRPCFNIVTMSLLADPVLFWPKVGYYIQN